MLRLFKKHVLSFFVLFMIFFMSIVTIPFWSITDTEMIILICLVGIGSISIISAVFYSKKKLYDFQNNIGDICLVSSKAQLWMRPLLEKIFNRTRLLVTGLLVCIILILLVGLSSNWLTYPMLWFKAPLQSFSFIVLWGIAAFCGGVGLHVVYGTLVIPSLLSRETKNLRLSLHAYKKFGVKKVGFLYLKFAVIIAFVVAISIFGVLVSPITKSRGIMVMAVFFTLTSFVYFIVSQWSIHLALTEQKAQLLESNSFAIEKTIKKINVNKKVDSHLEQRVSLLLNLRKEYLGMTDWSFSLPTLIKAIMSSLGPLLLLLLQHKEIFALLK